VVAVRVDAVFVDVLELAQLRHDTFRALFQRW
jgi:hypothetical protein